MYLQFSKHIYRNGQRLHYQDLTEAEQAAALKTMQIIINQFSHIRCCRHPEETTCVTLYLWNHYCTAQFDVCCDYLHILLEYVLNEKRLPHMVEHRQMTIAWLSN